MRHPAAADDAQSRQRRFSLSHSAAGSASMGGGRRGYDPASRGEKLLVSHGRVVGIPHGERDAREGSRRATSSRAPTSLRMVTVRAE